MAPSTGSVRNLHPIGLTEPHPMMQGELDFARVDQIVLLGHEIGKKFEIVRSPGRGLVANDFDRALLRHLQINVEALGGRV